MKYVDEERLRVGYGILFAAAVVLVAGAILDANYNGGRWVSWFISGLGGLFVVAILFFVLTEGILKEALNLAPAAHGVPADESPVAMPERQAAGPFSLRAASLGFGGVAGPATGAVGPMAVRPLSSRLIARREAWTPHEAPVVPPPPRVRIQFPEPVTVVAEPRESAATQPHPKHARAPPRPETIPPPPRGIATQTLAYEVGYPEFRLPRGAAGSWRLGMVLESTRILCGACGLYFRLDLEPQRPVGVQCPRCSKDLGLSGATATAQHVRMRCRHCGDFVVLPRVAEHKGTQCPTCGQTNG